MAGHYEAEIERHEQTHDFGHSAVVDLDERVIEEDRHASPSLHRLRCYCKTICLTMASMADTITIRTDDETEHALDVLTHDGSSRSAAIRQAVLEAARRRERAAEMRRAVLRLDLGQPDGVNVAEELARDRASER